jgi:outer membrane protein OmpA-like peptidoglycan-associated protein
MIRTPALAAAALLLTAGVPSWAQSADHSWAQSADSSWNGFYLGVNGGWFQSTNRSISNSGTDTGTSGLGSLLSGGAIAAHTGLGYSGGLGGGTAGYNWQVAPMWVLGAEADIDGIDAGRSSTLNTPGNFKGIGNPPFALGFTRNSDFSATLRARVGFVPIPQLMLFATGGLAVGEDEFGASFVCPSCSPPASVTRKISAWAPGAVAGGGVEWMVAPNWSVKAEYQRLFYPNLATSINYLYGTNISTLRSSIPITDNIVKVGINYHFSAPPPPPPAPAAMPAPPPPAAPKVFIVFFDWDKDTITPEGQAIVQQAADAYKSGAPVQIQVTGYADRSGSPSYNQRLSERRANNVAKVMVALGVPKEEMTVSGRGENDNRVPTADGVREPQNRRVEITS